jgi:hypothetical protein
VPSQRTRYFPFRTGTSDRSRINNWAHLDAERAVDLGAHIGAVVGCVFLLTRVNYLILASVQFCSPVPSGGETLNCLATP